MSPCPFPTTITITPRAPLIASCAFVLSDPADRLCVLDVIIKDRTFRLIGVYGPNVVSVLPKFFRRIELRNLSGRLEHRP